MKVDVVQAVTVTTTLEEAVAIRDWLDLNCDCKCPAVDALHDALDTNIEE